MQRLENVVRRYAWGSLTAIPSLLNIASDGEPWAELWVSAHPQGSSKTTGVPSSALYDLILENPIKYLGREVESRFGARLPFLMKLIAPARPLSLQVHPNIHQAQAGFERDANSEDEVGPTYVDPFHKPEMLYALEDFDILIGFRPLEQMVRILRALDHPSPSRWADQLAAAEGDASREGEAIQEVFSDIALHVDNNDVSARDYVEAARELVEAGVHDSVVVEAWSTFLDLDKEFPDDRGALLALLMNRTRLREGEAVFVGAGVVHCYLNGLGVEIMAASDNVLRAGLTPKRVDVKELLNITHFEPSAIAPVEPQHEPGSTLFSPEVEEFQLRIIEVDASVTLNPQGPRLALVLSGSVSINAGGDLVTLERGDSVIIEDSDGIITVMGSGKLAMGETPGLGVST